MKRLLLAAAVLASLAAGGCVFSSDDDATPPESDWQPELHVTPDSVYAWFPCEWPDTTTWTWNRAPRNTWEYVLEVSIPAGNITAHIAFATTGDGGEPRSGTLAEMVADGNGYFWTEDRRTGEYLLHPRPFARAFYRDGGIVVTTWFSPWLYGQVPPRTRYWTVAFTQRGRFDYRFVQRNAEFEPDRGQLAARRVDGPLSADDYAVMDRVLRAYLPNSWPSTVVVSTTRRGPGSYFDSTIDLLQADHDTRAAFDVVKTRTLDVSALSQLGYAMVESDDVAPGDVLYLGVSGVGFNHARNQALVYGTYYCGMLCAEGTMFLLEKVDGYWVIRMAIQLWIS